MTEREAALDGNVLEELRDIAQTRFGDILTLFISNGDKLLGQLKQAAKEGDAPAAARTLHALRSACGQVGAAAAARAALRMEQALTQETLAAMPLLKDVEEEYGRARGLLAALAASQN